MGFSAGGDGGRQPSFVAGPDSRPLAMGMVHHYYYCGGSQMPFTMEHSIWMNGLPIV